MIILTSILTTLATLAVTWFLGKERILAEFKLEQSAEKSLKKLLGVEKFRLRSFAILKRHVGGFTDDELRQLLVRAGAVRFYNGEDEMWGLLSRNEDRLE